MQLRVPPVPSDLGAELATGRTDLALGVSLPASPELRVRVRVLARDRCVRLALPQIWVGGADPELWAALPARAMSPRGAVWKGRGTTPWSPWG